MESSGSKDSSSKKRRILDKERPKRGGTGRGDLLLSRGTLKILSNKAPFSKEISPLQFPLFSPFFVRILLFLEESL